MDIQRRIAEVLAKEAAAISSIKVTPGFEQAVLALRDCRNKVLTTGMGKAGHIAAKFAATLCSTGTPAAYIHPGEAAHGDLGLIAKDDCIVAFSTSVCTCAAGAAKLSIRITTIISGLKPPASSDAFCNSALVFHAPSAPFATALSPFITTS
jgi:D-arabinose 5-phosphate isomerase GutQ